MRRRAPAVLLLTSCYAGLALLFTYPLAWHFGTHYPGEPGGDARVYLWNFWWVETSIREPGLSPFETDYIFYPLGIGLSLHTLALLPGVLLIPLRALAGEIAAVNLYVVGTFVASALGVYALARYLGASRAGAFLAGVVFAFCPYRLARLAGHYDLLATEWIAFYALALVAAFRSGDRRLAWLAGALAAACGYTAASYLVFLALFTLLFLAFRLAARADPPGLLARRALEIGVVAAVLLAPYLWRVALDLTSWRYPPYPGAEQYAANLAGYLLPGPGQTLLGGWIGRSFERNLTETIVFPGYLVLAIAAAALARPALRTAQRFWFLSAATFIVLSLGSRLRVGEASTGLPLPFALLQHVPSLEHLRAPSRFSVLVMLSLAMVVATFWTDWTARLSSPLLRNGAAALAAGILVAEYLTIPIPVFDGRVDPLYHRLAERPGDFTVVEIPGIDQVPGTIQFHQTAHEKRILIGTAARVPREKLDYFFGLPLVRPLVDLRKGNLELTPELLAREKELSPRVARFLDLRYLVVHRAYERRGVTDFLRAVLPVDTAHQDDDRLVLRVEPDRLPPLPRVLDPGAPESRLYFAIGWSRPERGEGASFRWADRERSWILFRRPAPEVSAVVLVLEPLPDTRQQLEVRLEGKRLGRFRLAAGWQEIRLPLPPIDGAPVERLELRWDELRRVSDRDPRRLAARVSAVRIDEH